MSDKPEEFVHITDGAWAASCAAFPRSVAEETPNIIQWAAEAIQAYGDEARSQAFEEIAAYVEGKDGNIPAAAVFAPLVSQNRMPDMSGDPRARLSPPRRREFDDATRALSQAIRQHSQKGKSE